MALQRREHVLLQGKGELQEEDRYNARKQLLVQGAVLTHRGVLQQRRRSGACGTEIVMRPLEKIHWGMCVRGCPCEWNPPCGGFGLGSGGFECSGKFGAFQWHLKIFEKPKAPKCCL